MGLACFHRIALACLVGAGVWGDVVRADTVSASLASLPTADAFARHFDAIARQDLVFYRTFMRRGWVDRERAARFLELALGRSPLDPDIAAALDTLAPGTTVRDFLSRLHPGRAIGPAELRAFLADPPRKPFEGPADVSLWRRTTSRLRRHLLSRLVSDPSAPVQASNPQLFRESLGRTPSPRSFHVAVPFDLLPRSWWPQARAWRRPNAFPLLETLLGEARRAGTDVTFFATLPRRTLRPDGDLQKALDALDALDRHAPNLVRGIQLGSALGDARDSERASSAQCDEVTGRLLRVFHFAAARGWALRFDGLVLPGTGVWQRALLGALAAYGDGPELEVAVSQVGSIPQSASRVRLVADASVPLGEWVDPSFAVDAPTSESDARTCADLLLENSRARHPDAKRTDD